jgi:hypothetical protein
MTYEGLGTRALDYFPCRYGASKLLFRGPRRSLETAYCAFIGGTETYGKFIASPFPAIVERDIGMPCINLGFPNAGIDVFLHDPFVPVAALGAQVSVVQVMGAQNMSNRFYSVHPRRNDRFVKASQMMQAVYGDVDFTEYHFTKHMIRALMALSADRFSCVRRELQQAWQARMALLLSKLEGKIILLWFARHSPDEDRSCTTGDPMFVTRKMIETLRPHVADIVEVVASPAAQAQGTRGMVFAQMEAPAAGHIMGPAAHGEAADAVSRSLARLL